MWMKELYDTYQNMEERFAGKRIEGNVLLPVSHVWVNAQIECVLDEEANLFDAHVIDKKDAATMIPCTIASANRTSKPVPHPLFDKLSYIAKELHTEHKGEILYETYRKTLKAWSEQEDAPKSLKILFTYLDKGKLIKDLVDRQILFEENGVLLSKWNQDSKTKPEIFKVLNGEQEKAVVRFSIREFESGNIIPIWMDRAVHKSYLEYYLPTIQDQNLCMVTGEIRPVTDLHSAYLRFPGDSAKLISSQDTLGFKYSGRNQEASEALSVSYEASQKAHNALKWLIQRQGYKMNGYVALVWGTKEPDVIKPMESNYSLFSDHSQELPMTEDDYGNSLKKVLSGIYQKRFHDPDENVIIMCMDAATKGRLAILFYQSLKGSQFLERIHHWYDTFSWKGMSYFQKNEETGKQQKHYYLGTPSFKSVLNALYGSVDSDDMNKIKKTAFTTLLSCMIDGKQLPRNYVQIVVDKFSRPMRLENEMPQDDFLAIACAIIRKYRNDLSPDKKEVWKMDVDYEQKQTFYLWGRLLAYAEWMERRANYVTKEDRDTNATRYRFEFEHHPAKAWRVISDKLNPYRKKLIKYNKGYEVEKLESEMEKIMHILEMREDNNQPLDDRYILGYGAQLFELKEQLKK